MILIPGFEQAEVSESSQRGCMDSLGLELPLVAYEGCNFLSYPLGTELPTHVSDVRNMSIREDDIIVIGFPKSGNRFLEKILTSLIQPARDGFQILDCNSPDRLSDLPSPRILHTHFPFRFLPNQLLSQLPNVIYLARNPKDVCVSQYKQLKKRCGYIQPFQTYADIFLNHTAEYGGWFHYMLQYNQYFKDHPELPVHTIYFEDMYSNCYSETRALCSFLGVDPDNEAIVELVENVCNDDQTIPHKRMKVDHLEAKTLKPTPEHYYCEGEVGEWKNWLTVALDEEFDSVIGQTIGEWPKYGS